MDDSKKTVTSWWGLGRSLLTVVLFSNGATGTSLYPLFHNNSELVPLAVLAIYIPYCSALFLGITAFRRFLEPLKENGALISLGASLAVLGLVLVLLSGSELMEPMFYFAGAVLIGVGGAIPVLGWGEYYAAIDVRTACVLISSSGCVASVLYLAVSIIGARDSALLSICLMLLLIASQFMLLSAWKAKDAPQLDPETRHEPFRCPAPLFMAIFGFGLAFGIILGLGSLQTRAGLDAVHWAKALGMGLVSLLILFYAVRRKFSITRLYQPLVLIIVGGLLMIPLFLEKLFFVSDMLAYAGYFYTVVFSVALASEITRRARKSALAVSGMLIFAHSFGTMCGNLTCMGLFGNGINPTLLYVISVVAVGLLVAVTIFLLSESRTDHLWGLVDVLAAGPGKEGAEPCEDAFPRKCATLSEAHMLTAREAEILVRLAKGLGAQEICDEFSLSMATVRSHMKRIYTKLDVHSQRELIKMVMDADQAKS